ncbi:MAG: type II toxin-antitoxin system HicA family toxin [Coriobacteriia bacterium]|nr:type II toxin-antitoxin system HicA family toxin [Coriobacteriia bacterium]MCL2870892.1 type II toxin-antitoxin system HicA family toxin [Coriobacteriia bacterium]
MERRKAIKALSEAGFEFLREGGNHSIFQHPDGRKIQVPRHRNIKKGTWKAVKKRAGL